MNFLLFQLQSSNSSWTRILISPLNRAVHLLSLFIEPLAENIIVPWNLWFFKNISSLLEYRCSQCCVSFRCTAEWFSYTFIKTCIYFFFKFFPPFMLLQNIEQHYLCCTVGPCWLYVLNATVCTCQSQSPNLSPLPNLPPL